MSIEKIADNNEINVISILERLKHVKSLLILKWKLIMLVVILTSIIGIIFSTFTKIKYNSSLSFVVEGEGATGLASLASTFGLGKGAANQGVFSSANMLDLLKSRSLIEKALLEPLPYDKSKSFADLYFKFKGWDDVKDEKIKNLKFKPNTPSKKLSLEQNSILSDIYYTLTKKELEVEIKNPDNTIMYITLKIEDKDFCRYFPEELIKVSSEFYIETKTRKAKLNYTVLQQQTDSVRRELYNAITGVAAANDNTFLLNPAFNVKRVPSAHKEVSVQANQVILAELVKNLELSRMSLLNETPIIEIIDRPISPLVGTKMGKIKSGLIGGFLGGFLIISLIISIDFLKSLNNKNS
jgi:uncharacterized protein involved in exopolysaccharide biosynthesis